VTRESPLAALLPVWRTLREQGTTALVTPALDYVGALEVEGVDARYASDGRIQAVGEGLRALVASLEDGTTLHFVRRVAPDTGAEVQEYERATAAGPCPAARAYASARAAWLRSRGLNSTRTYLFFSAPAEPGQVTWRGSLGWRLPFMAARLTRADHERRLARLGTLRDRILTRLAALGIAGRELAPEDVRTVHDQLLNPGAWRGGAAQRPPCPLAAGPQPRREDAGTDEFTEAELLAREDLEEHRGYLRQGGVARRVATLRVLPEGGTGYFAAEPLLAMNGGAGTLPHTLSVAVHVQAQRPARFLLNNQHALVENLRHVVPFLERRTVEGEESGRAKREDIRGLFEELARTGSRIVSLSVSVLLEGASLRELDAATEAARGAFAAAGNSEVLLEERTQLPAFLSMLPGAGRYQLRRKGCTSRNAADFLPVFAAWRGAAKAASLLSTPSGEAFRFDPFDRSGGLNAHHGIVVADTGSGKSVTLGALTLDARAAGVEAVLVDNGRSWAPLTEFLGGVHVSVDLSTSISPFLSYADLAGPDGTVTSEDVEQVVQFLEVCAADRSRPPFDKVERDVVARAVRWGYETRFRSRPAEAPLIGQLCAALSDHPFTHPDDRAIAQGLVRRLGIYCTGIYADFLNRPSRLRFDAPLLAFDLGRVSQSAATRSVAMATIVQAIANRAATRKARTLVEIDEGHEFLGAGDAAERFLGGCYRKMRKHGTAMWMISQNLNDFMASRVGREAIVGNSTIRIFLRHLPGKHRPVIEHFGLPPRAAEAFQRLELKPGHHSDFLLLYGERTSVVRLALDPLAYWILTTDKEDRDYLESAARRNPHLPRVSLLQEIARRHPHGVVDRRREGRPSAP